MLYTPSWLYVGVQLNAPVPGVNEAPAGRLVALRVGNGTGVFTWTPTFEQAGSYDVTFGASDGTASDNELVTITVNDVNRAPVLSQIDPKSTTVGTQLLFNVMANDPDNDPLIFYAHDLPAGGESFVDNNDGTGTFDWTPGLDQSGSYPVIFEVQDSFGFDSQTVVITVNPTANQAPGACGNRPEDGR